MRSILATFLMVLVLGAIVLIGGVVAALGIAAAGWLIHRIFDLTQWQGSLIALAAVLGVGYLVYQLGGPPAPVTGANVDWEGWQGAPTEEETPQPSLVAWRQRRPTSGHLPSDGKSRSPGGGDPGRSK